MSKHGGPTLGEWFVNLDQQTRGEAHRCLCSGTYSRRLLLSLRAALPPASGHRHGLEDPHTAAPGDPLGAALQTFLREQFLRPLRTGTSFPPTARQGGGPAVLRQPGRQPSDSACGPAAAGGPEAG